MNEYQIGGKTITEHLLTLAERGNRPFTENLHPGIPGVLGVRIPDLRNLAKAIVRSGSWQDYLTEAERGVNSPEQDFMEARTLHGLVLGLIPHPDLEEYLSRVACWVKRINSWSVCDCFTFSGRDRFVSKHSDRIWQFLLPYLEEAGEYEVRFGIVVLMQYFIDEEHVLPLLRHYEGVQHEGYYVRMALAWAIAECYIHYHKETLPFLTAQRFPVWVHNKAIQKACESFRITPEEKATLRSLRVKA